MAFGVSFMDVTGVVFESSIGIVTESFSRLFTFSGSPIAGRFSFCSRFVNRWFRPWAPSTFSVPFSDKLSGEIEWSFSNSDNSSEYQPAVDSGSPVGCRSLISA